MEPDFFGGRPSFKARSSSDSPDKSSDPEKPFSASFPARPLGAFEQLFWLRSQVSTVHFLVAGEVEGSTRPEEWRTALDAVQRRHPMLYSTIRQDKDTSLWFVPRPERPIPLRVVDGDKLFRWESQMELELSMPFNSLAWPLFRAVLIHYPDRSIIILTSHLCISDGLSLTYIMRDLLEALSGKVLKPLPFPASSDNLLNLRDSVVGSPPMKSPPLQECRADVLRIKARSNIVPRVHIQALSPELTDKLIGRARKENTTLQGLMVSALVAAGRRLFKKWENNAVRILSPVSFRELFGVDENCCIYLSGRMLNFDPGETRSFWQQARHVQSFLAAIRNYEYLRKKSKGLYKLMDGKDFSGVREGLIWFKREGIVANIGRIKYNTDFGRVRLVSLWGPAIHSGFEDEYSLSLSTINNSCCLSMTTREPNGQLLLQELLGELNAIVAHQ